MTVAELIKELEKIEDKNLDVVSGLGEIEDCLMEFVYITKGWYTKEDILERRKCVKIL